MSSTLLYWIGIVYLPWPYVSTFLYIISIAQTTPLKSQLLTLFIKVYECRVIESNEISFIIDAGHIRRSITHYERHIKSCIAVRSRIYYCYCLFVSSLSLAIILTSDHMIVIALNKNAINKAYLDYCG